MMPQYLWSPSLMICKLYAMLISGHSFIIPVFKQYTYATIFYCIIVAVCVCMHKVPLKILLREFQYKIN